MLSFCISLVPSKSKHKFLNFVLISQLVIRFMNSESWSNIPVNLCYVPHQPILRVGWHSSANPKSGVAFIIINELYRRNRIPYLVKYFCYGGG